MTRHRPADEYAPEPNIVERKAQLYLEASSRSGTDHAQDRPLAPALRRVQRRAIGWAVVAGLVSGGLLGGAELVANDLGSNGGSGEGTVEGWLADWHIWVGYLAFAGLVSAVEILFLYWNAFRATAAFATLAGTRLSGHPHSELVARGLARGGLEFPNPQARIFGIDAHARIPAWRIKAQIALYKMKVGVSSFVIRLFLRRVFGRMLVRGIIPLAAGPLYAVWNAVITWWICREARLRVFGPRAVEELVASLAQEPEISDPGFRDRLFDGVGELVMRGRDAHPNFVLVLSKLRETLGHTEDEIAVDWDKARQSLDSLTEPQQRAAMATWTLTALLGSRIHREQQALLHDAASACGFGFDRDHLQQLRRDLLDGRRIGPTELAAGLS
jgi:hypothetical protein